jgi:hypothetical protein
MILLLPFYDEWLPDTPSVRMLLDPANCPYVHDVAFVFDFLSIAVR